MNKVTLMGRLVRDPEVINSTVTVCKFTLAVNRKFKKEGEQSADYIQIVSFGKTAEFCSKYFSKGQQVAVAGRIQTRTWEEEGKKRYSTDVIAEEVYFADSKKESQSSQESQSLENTLIDDDDELPF